MKYFFYIIESLKDGMDYSGSLTMVLPLCFL
jgi:hypothetical protein